MSRIKANSDSKFASSLDNSKYFNREVDETVTQLPILNLAISGKLDGGFIYGVHTIAGESRRFKTLFGLYMMSAYLKKYPNAIAIMYDTEFGMTDEYIEKFDLDKSRILHIPVMSVEELKHEVVTQLDDLISDVDPKGENKNKVFMFVDSLGMLPSLKEYEDAVKGDPKADLTRSKQIKSFFRLITVKLKLLDMPFVCIQHVYKELSGGQYAATVVSGGQGGILASDTIWVIGKQQDKEGSGVNRKLLGYNFIITVDKSRKVKEKSKFKITVHWEDGIHKYSGLADLATELKLIEKIKIGQSVGYKYKDMEIKSKFIDTDDLFWDTVLEETKLKELLTKKFKQ